MPEKTKELRLDKIRIDGGTQTRAALNNATVNDYAEAMEDNAIFPPLVVFFDGTDHWLGDGFHRFHGYRKAGVGEADCIVHQGTKEDALLFALGANSQHGLPRTNADKRKAVGIVLEHAEWGKWSDERIAEKCAVSRRSVMKWRAESKPSPVNGSQVETRIGRDGRECKLPERKSETVPEGESSEPGPVAKAFQGLAEKKSTAVHRTHFDDAEHGRVFGLMTRFYQSRAEVKKCVNCPEHKALGALLDQLLEKFGEWQKRVPA